MPLAPNNNFTPDFSGDWAGFVQQSSCWRLVEEALRMEMAYEKAGVCQAESMLAAAAFMFEAYVIFTALAPDQALYIFRAPLAGLAHAYHSKETKSWAASHSAQDRGQGEFVKNFVYLNMMRPHYEHALRHDVAHRLAELAARAESRVLSAEAKVEQVPAEGASRRAAL